MILGVTFILLLHFAFSRAGIGSLRKARVPSRDDQFTAGFPANADRVTRDRDVSGIEADGWHNFITRPDLRPPRLRIEGSGSPGYLFFTPGYLTDITNPDSERYSCLVIADSATGDIVWVQESEISSLNLKHQKLFGSDVLVYWDGSMDRGNTIRGVNYILNSSYVAIDHINISHYDALDESLYPTSAFHSWSKSTDPHDFMLQDGGYLVTLVSEVIPQDLTVIGGPKTGFMFNSRILKIDLRSRETVFDWSALDHISLSESLYTLFPDQGTEEVPWGYVHFNSLDIHPFDGSLLVSSRGTGSLFKINITTGDIVWRLGGRRSDFTMGDSSVFQSQHHVNWVSANEISIFDNQIPYDTLQDDATSPETSSKPSGFPLQHIYSQTPLTIAPSRGIILNVNFDDMSCVLQAEFKHPDEPSVYATGSMQLLENGNAFVGYGPAGFGAEFAPNGSVISTLRYAPDGGSASSYRMIHYSDWTADPKTTPDVVVTNRTVYMSWNGATKVKYWNVFAGSCMACLKPLSRVSKTGFETMFSLSLDSRLSPFFQVEALDAQNHTLAFSEVVRNSGYMGNRNDRLGIWHSSTSGMRRLDLPVYVCIGVFVVLILYAAREYSIRRSKIVL